MSNARDAYETAFDRLLELEGIVRSRAESGDLAAVRVGRTWRVQEARGVMMPTGMEQDELALRSLIARYYLTD